MPKIIIKCSKGKDELGVSDSYVDSMGNIVIEVGTFCCVPPNWGECGSCEEVEELTRVKKQIKEMVEAIT